MPVLIVVVLLRRHVHQTVLLLYLSLLLLLLPLPAVSHRHCSTSGDTAVSSCTAVIYTRTRYLPVILLPLASAKC
jgi:hypothetical protein